MYFKALYLHDFFLNQFINMKRIIYGVLIMCIGITTLNSQSQCFQDGDGNWITPFGTPCTNTIVTAVPFLRIVPDARSGALGDAGIGLSADANAMHFNASKLAFAEENLSVSATYSPWLRALGLTDVYLAYLTGYKKINEEPGNRW